jgi:hypothetical protein
MALDEVIKSMAKVGKANAKGAWVISKAAPKLARKAAKTTVKVASGGKA